MSAGQDCIAAQQRVGAMLAGLAKQQAANAERHERICIAQQRLASVQVG